MGLVDREALWESYGDNLTYVLDSVGDVLDTIEGKVVVTSDHGNMLGERTFPVPMRVYGHPKGLRNRELVDVPWAIVTCGSRRRVTDDDVVGTCETDTEVERRLNDLGYV
jgi:arylsulfatase A-like enzyme